MTRTHALRLASGAALTSLALVLAACGGGGERAEKAEGAEAAAAGDYERGPNNGRLLRDGDFSLEVTIYEEGPEPLFRIYP